MYSGHECTPARRCRLVNWLSECARYHSFRPETFHKAIGLLDSYLLVLQEPASYSSDCGVPLRKNRLQLLGAACLLLAGKLEEIYPPAVSDYAHLCDGQYSLREICDTELDICKVFLAVMMVIVGTRLAGQCADGL